MPKELGGNMTIDFLRGQMQKLNEQITSILTQSGYHKMEDLTEIEWDSQNPDDWMLYYKFLEISYLLKQIKQVLDYLEKPILHEGVVTHENDRFCLDGMILHDGQCIEILTKNEYTKKYVWKKCFVKYPGESHSLVQAGVKGRIRE